MNWLISISLTLLLVYTQQGHVEARRGHHGSGSSSKSPWANPVKAQAFMKCLIQKIGKSPVFPDQEKEDMEEIVETMMSAFSSMSSSGGSNAAKMQAMNMAFASSMAELVIAEDADDLESINVKTEALAKALQQCFKSTLGTVNRHFITEIKDLIGMFAKEAAANDDASENEVGDDLDLGGMGEGIQPSIISVGDDQLSGKYPTGEVGAAIPSLDAGLAGGYPVGTGPDMFGPSSTGGITARLSVPLTSSLSGSKVFRAAFNARTSTGAAVNLSKNIANVIAANFRLDAGTGAKLRNAIVSAVSIIRMGSDTRNYAQAIANATADVLATSGQLSGSDLNQKAPKLISVFVQGVSSNAPQFGIDLSGINIQDDLSNASRGILVSLQSGPSLGGMGPDAGIGPGLDTGYGPSPDSGYPGDVGSISLGQDLGAPSSTGGDATSKLAQSLVNALLRSDTFKAIFNKDVSQRNALIESNSALQSIAASVGLDGATLSQLKNKITQSLSTVGAGSDTSAYAKVMATNIATVLGSSGKVNNGNVNQLGSSIAGAIIKGSAAIAPRLGLRLPNVNVDADIGNVQSYIMSGAAGGPSGGATGSLDVDLTGGYPGGASPDTLGLSAPGGLTVRLSAPLTSSLLNSKVFRAAFNARTSKGVAISLSRNLADTIAANFGLDANTGAKLKNAIVSAVSKVRTGSDTRDYAQAISNATADVLASSGQLSDSDLNQKAPKLISVFVQGVSSNAPRFGIDLSGINVQDDLSNASRGIVVSIQSGSAAGGQGPDADYSAADSSIPLDVTDISDVLLKVPGGRPAPLSMKSLADSPVGLKSPAAAARVNKMASIVAQLVGPNGVDVNNFMNVVKSSVNQLSNAGLSRSDATVEALMEAMVALMQVLKSAQISRVDTSSTLNTSNSVAVALSAF